MFTALSMTVSVVVLVQLMAAADDAAVAPEDSPEPEAAPLDDALDWL
jgi:hypothetical protein